MAHCLIIFLCALWIPPHVADAKLFPSKVVSFAPSQVDGSQHALVHVFGSRPFNVSYRTWLGQEDTKIINGERQFYSQPYGNLHLVEIPYVPPGPLDPGRTVERRLELIVDFCYANHTCELTEQTTRLIHRIRVSHRNTLIVIETDKAVYRPMDRMRIRCALLHPQHWTMGSPESLSKFIHPASSTLMRAPSKSESMSDPSQTFDSITIYTANNQVVHKWIRLSREEARNLTYEIPIKPVDFGDWTIKAQSRGRTKDLKVHIMPERIKVPVIRFTQVQWYYNEPEESNRPIRIEFRLCAIDSTGLAASGPVKVLWCDCPLYHTYHTNFPEHALLSKELTDSLIRNEACLEKTGVNHSRPCAVSSAQLDTDGCRLFQLAYRDLGMTNFNLFHQNNEPIRCAEIFDSGAGQWHRQCERITQHEFRKMKGIKMWTWSYKYGLPTQFSGQVWNLHYTGLRVDLVVEQQLSKCHLTANRSLHMDHRTTMRVFTKIDGTGHINFTLRPMYTFDPMLITGTFVNKFVDEGPLTIGNEYLLAYVAPSRSMIQLWPDQGELLVNCNQTTRILIMGNQPLSDERFFVYGSLRATLIPLELDDYSLTDRTEDVNCPFRDDWLGHHEACQPENPDLLNCLPGWRGKGCLEPVCAKNCDPVGGYCSSPGGCECKTGWMGSDCDQCFYAFPPGFCETGDECGCSWYNRTGTPYFGTLPPLVPMTTIAQSYERTTAARALYRRTLRVKLNREISSPMPISIFYLESLEDGHLAVISTRAELLPGKQCTDDIGQPLVRFNVTQARFGEVVQLTVTLPKRANGDNETVCHATVWNELQDNAGGYRTRIDSSHPIDLLFTPTEANSLMGSYPPSSPLELWQSGISEGLDLIENNDRNFTECNMLYLKPSRFAVDEHKGQPWSLDTMLFDWFRPMALEEASRAFGTRFYLRVPPVGARWRATAFCYGSDIGLWTSVSDALVVAPELIFDLSLTSSLNLFEMAQVKASIEFIAPHQSGCSEWSLHVTLSPGHLLQIVGAEGYSQCVCDGQTKEKFITHVKPNIAKTSEVKVHVNINPDAPQCNLPIKDLLKSDIRSFGGSDQQSIQRTRVKSISIRTASTEIEYISALVCTKQSLGGVNSQHIKLAIPNNSPRINQRYLSISPDVAGLVFEQFASGIRKPLLSGYDHLGILVSGTHLLNYMESEYKRSNRIFGTIRAHTYRAVVASFTALTALRCLDGSYGPFGGECGHPDLWYESLLYRSMALLLKSSNRWLQDFVDFPANNIIWNIGQRWKALQDDDGCFPPPPETPTGKRHQARLALTAHMWISLHENYVIKSFWSQAVDVKPVMSKAEKCLSEILLSELKGKAAPANRYEGGLMATLAHMFTTINMQYPTTHALVKMMRKKQIKRKDAVDKGHNLVHWGSGDDEVEATAYAYWALRKTGFKPRAILPVVRWLLEKQSMHGYFPTGRDLYFGSAVLLDYSSWIKQDQRFALPLPVRIKVHMREHLERRLQLHGWDLRTTLMRLPDIDHVNITIDDPKGHYCLVLRTSVLSPSNRDQTVSESRLATVQPRNQSDCNHVTVSICLEHILLKRILGLYIFGQSGWCVDETTRASATGGAGYRTELIRKLDFPLNSDVHILLNSTVRNDSGNTHCFQLNYTRMGAVKRAKPLIVMVLSEEFLQGEYLYTIRLPDCPGDSPTLALDDYQIEKEKTRRNTGLLECPTILNTQNEDRAKLMEELEQLCETEIFIIHMNHSVILDGIQNPIRVYRIGNDSQIAHWSTNLSDQASRCGLFNQAAVYAGLRHPRIDLRPADLTLNLRAVRSENDSTVRLIQLDRGKTGMNEMLASLVKPCRSLQSMIRLVYGKLI